MVKTPMKNQYGKFHTVHWGLFLHIFLECSFAFSLFYIYTERLSNVSVFIFTVCFITASLIIINCTFALKVPQVRRVSSLRWRKCQTLLCNRRVMFSSRPFVALHHDKTTRWYIDCDLHCAYDRSLEFTSPVWLSGSRWSIFSFISTHLTINISE